MNVPNLHNLVSESAPGDFAPLVLGPEWQRGPLMVEGEEMATVFVDRAHGVKVIMSKSAMDDGSEWIHLSVSQPSRGEPSFQTLWAMKNLFLGAEREAVQVFPKKRDFVDIANAYHLWVPLP